MSNCVFPTAGLSPETHCAHPRLPRSLCAHLVSAGFRVDEVVVFPILNLRWANTAYSTGLAGFVQDFVGRKNELTAEELHEWYDELARLSETGRYFFSSNRYMFLASRPARSV